VPTGPLHQSLQLRDSVHHLGNLRLVMKVKSGACRPGSITQDILGQSMVREDLMAIGTKLEKGRFARLNRPFKSLRECIV
jgi:hypothetical protein